MCTCLASYSSLHTHSLSCWPCSQAIGGTASFPGYRRNSLATSASSNCYFCCHKIGSSNQFSEHHYHDSRKSNCVLCCYIAVMPTQLQLHIILADHSITLVQRSTQSLFPAHGSNCRLQVLPQASSSFLNKHKPTMCVNLLQCDSAIAVMLRP